MLESDARVPTASRLRSPGVILAAACMASAGLVHAAAAGAHNEHPTMATMFAMTAVAQLGWAAIVMIRPQRWLFSIGAVIGFGAVGVWAVSRVWGIGFVEGLAGAQPIEFQDSVATVLGLVAGLAALSALWRPVTNGRTVALTRIAVVLGALALVAAVPASAAPHGGNHDDGALAHGDDGALAHGDDDDGLRAVTIEGYTYQADVTDEQVAAAQALIDDTKAALAESPYWDYDAALADGYVSIGDDVTGFNHVVHVGYIADGDTILDPNAIESLVYRVQPDGSKVLVSAMYLLGLGKTMDDAPDIAGDITQWHDHQNLCWDENNPTRVVGITNEDGECARGVFRATQPMLHVWLVDDRCGPFAGIEGSHGDACDHEEH